MSSLISSGSSSGTGSMTLLAPVTNSNQTVTIPDVTGNVVIDSATQTLTNKTIQGGTITSGTAVASTSGTSIDFTGIPSWVKRITVMFNGISTNGSSAVQIQIGAGSVTTSGYTSTSANAYGTNSVAVASSSAGFITQFASASSARNGQMILTNVSGNIWVSSHMMGDVSGQGGCVGGGTVTLSGTLDRIRITTVNGTDAFDAGSINILYE